MDFDFEQDMNDLQENAAEILKGFIEESPGRADLFEAYAAKGLPLNGKAFGRYHDTPIEFIIENFDDMIEKHGEDTILNLICLLVKLGVDPNDALYHSLVYGKEKVEEKLAEIGVKANTETLRNVIHKIGLSLTDKSFEDNRALSHNFDFLERLLGRGVEPEDTLCLMAEYGSKLDSKYRVYGNSPDTFYDTIRLLLEHGADKNVKDKSGKTPLDYAMMGTNKEITNLFKPSSILDHVGFGRIICAAGFSLGVWALLGRVFGLGIGWNIIASLAVAVGSYFIISALWNSETDSSFTLLIMSFAPVLLAIAGVVCFFAIPKPDKAVSENPTPIEINIQEEQ
jgi:hypothetical protein